MSCAVCAGLTLNNEQRARGEFSCAPTIAEFLLFDAEFPHSVRFSVERIVEALNAVAPGAPPTRRAVSGRLAGRLKAAVDFGQIDELTGGSIDSFLMNISRQCEDIHKAVFAAYVAYDAETVL